VVQPFRQTRPFQLARAIFARRLRYPPLPPEVRARLAVYYAADVGRLGELLGRDLSAWLAPPCEERAAPGEPGRRSEAHAAPAGA
jgi:hypothetical protein